MESLISDKNAMDPEVVVPDGVGVCHTSSTAVPTTVGTVLWVGLPRSWALAVFVIAGAGVTLWDLPTCLVGLTVAGLLACARGKCMDVQSTGSGVWFLILHHCCSLAALASCMRSTLQYMGGGSKLRSWLASHIAQSPHMFTTLVLLFVTVLFVLGLGRSRLLRSGLIGGIPATLALLILSCYLFYKQPFAQQLFYTSLTLNQIAGSTAFFTLIFSGAMERTIVQKQMFLTSFAAIFVLVLSCVLAVTFISIVTEKKNLDSGILLIDSMKYNNEVVGGWEMRLVRDGLAIMATLSLSLSLVEVLATGQRSLASVAGHILPAAVARDNRWTGTQLLAILIAGLVSSTLVCLSPLSTLLMLSSVSYLLSQSCDLLSALYCSYQPSFVPKHSGEEAEGGNSYQLLSDTSYIMESEDSDSELSDDSGHSTDTDIDAVVHEYKETIKVATAITEPVLEPSVTTSRHATYSMLALLLASLGLGTSVKLGYTHLSLLGVLEVVFFTFLVSRQPQQLDLPHIYPLPPWNSCLTVSLNLALVSQLVSSVWLPLLVWTILGVSLWIYQQRRLWLSWQSTLHGRVDRARLRTTHHRLNPLSFLPTYRKTTHIDTVHIVR